MSCWRRVQVLGFRASGFRVSGMQALVLFLRCRLSLCTLISTDLLASGVFIQGCTLSPLPSSALDRWLACLLALLLAWACVYKQVNKYVNKPNICVYIYIYIHVHTYIFGGRICVMTTKGDYYSLFISLCSGRV